MSLGASWAYLIENSPVSEEPIPHVSDEELNSPARPPLAFASGTGPQEVNTTTKKNLTSSAKYDL